MYIQIKTKNDIKACYITLAIMIHGIDDKYRKTHAPQKGDRDFLGFNSNCVNNSQRLYIHIFYKVECISYAANGLYSLCGNQAFKYQSEPRLILH